MKRLSKKKCIEVAKLLRVDLEVVGEGQWCDGMKVELEHGTLFGVTSKTNITHDDYLITGKIALAHLIEDPFYYYRLETMEKDAKRWWRGKIKPKVTY